MASRFSLGSVAGTVVVLGAATFLTGTAQAQDPPDFLMTWDASGDAVGENTYNWNQFGDNPVFGSYSKIPNSNETWTGWQYTGNLAGPQNEWSLQWNCVFNNDVGGVATGGGSFVTANIVVTNNDQFNVQNFSLLMTLPVGRALVTPLERGSIVGTVTDLTLDDATVSAPVGGRIYTPFIDGVAEAPGFLMADPFTANAGGPLFTSTVGPQDFGVPAPVAANAAAANTSISILLDFDLTGGDSAQFTAIFEVLPIPGPGGLPVLAALGFLAGRRRRR